MHFEHKATIKNMLELYLKDKGIDTTKRFRCFNNCDGSSKLTMGFKHDMVNCFRCGTKFDTFELIGLDYNLNTFREQYQQACIIFNLEDEFNKYKYKKTALKAKNSIVDNRKEEELKEKKYNDFYNKLIKRKFELKKELEGVKDRMSKDYQDICFKIDFIDDFTGQILEYNNKSLELIKDFKRLYKLSYNQFKKYYLDVI
jgi:hypothetical protein